MQSVFSRTSGRQKTGMEIFGMKELYLFFFRLFVCLRLWWEGYCPGAVLFCGLIDSNPFRLLRTDVAGDGVQTLPRMSPRKWKK